MTADSLWYHLPVGPTEAIRVAVGLKSLPNDRWLITLRLDDKLVLAEVTRDPCLTLFGASA